MAGICSSAVITSTTYYSKITNTTRCCSNPSTNRISKKQTPKLLKFAVNGVTEFLRIFSFVGNTNRMDMVESKEEEELLVYGVDDILAILKSDYENAYFVTGRDLYSRNLKLLVPFFEQPSIVLKSIEKGVDAGSDFVLANWSLRTYLKLPWRPLIAIEGSTIYDLNDKYKIVRHVERWSVSAVDAVGQIFTPGFRRSLD
ncbi:uncharacterized protein LOC104890919 isoform X6 [Beta vulgaris subsp. vulgaris]|uniref:uncharacterized protein LOC104890919 isoform X6 n=1 Tax=Beta vulgaris subsp. vulgaris TaxID=3555 RepID=UPI00203678AB|nr:uncharacterized protein LOC104890919 isoform X6 [Beta vulgaris subsp. vulgaris]